MTTAPLLIWLLLSWMMAPWQGLAPTPGGLKGYPGGGTPGTLGYTGNGDSTDLTDDYRLACGPYTFSGTTGQHISAWHWRGSYSSSSTQTVYIGLYADSTGAPAALLESFSHSVNLTTTITSFTGSVSGSYSLTASSVYWIGTASSAGIGWKNAILSSGVAYYSSGITLPSPWSGASTFTATCAAYFDYN